ncbi:MAG TPA: hypothetical protein VIP09_11130 [Dehalococcoidia bacterium]|jgi:hypothetical protein
MLSHTKPFYRAAFNLGVLIATGAVYCGVVSVFSFDTYDWPARLGPLIAAAGAPTSSIRPRHDAISTDNRIHPFSI